MQIEITDNSGLAKEEMLAAALRALEKCGLTAEGYAKLLCPVDTGNLRNSITHQVEPTEPAVYIGTNSEYGPYVELGTGKYYPGGRQNALGVPGRKGPMAPDPRPAGQPYLKPAVADHVPQYKGIIEGEMRG